MITLQHKVKGNHFSHPDLLCAIHLMPSVLQIHLNIGQMCMKKFYSNVSISAFIILRVEHKYYLRDCYIKNKTIYSYDCNSLLCGTMKGQKWKTSCNLEKVLEESRKSRDHEGLKGTDSRNFKWVITVTIKIQWSKKKKKRWYLNSQAP